MCITADSTNFFPGFLPFNAWKKRRKSAIITLYEPG
jgi:hypothetical protein